MFDELKGRRVLVTGASRGIGAAEARHIVDEAAEQLCGLDPRQCRGTRRNHYRFP